MVNINQLLKQAQSMQKKMQDMQEQMSTKEYQGQSGGGLVSITIAGSGELKAVNIDPSMLKPEEKEVLEDLLVAAFNDAKQKLSNDSQDALSGAFGNLGLPPGMKFPF